MSAAAPGEAWTAEKIGAMARGYQAACVLMAAAELDLFTQLEPRPASALGCDERALTVLLDALAALGLLDKSGGLPPRPPSVRGGPRVGERGRPPEFPGAEPPSLSQGILVHGPGRAPPHPRRGDGGVPHIPGLRSALRRQHALRDRGGGTYTFREFREDLEGAGLRGIELLHADAGMHSLVSAQKP